MKIGYLQKCFYCSEVAIAVCCCSRIFSFSKTASFSHNERDSSTTSAVGTWEVTSSLSESPFNSFAGVAVSAFVLTTSLGGEDEIDSDAGSGVDSDFCSMLVSLFVSASVEEALSSLALCSFCCVGSASSRGRFDSWLSPSSGDSRFSPTVVEFSVSKWI